MTNLTSLQLQANVIDDVAGAFGELKSLTILDMRRNKVKTIPNSLPEGLQQLYLEFTDRESVLVRFLTVLPKLQFVRLAHNKLTDKGLFNVN